MGYRVVVSQCGSDRQYHIYIPDAEVEPKYAELTGREQELLSKLEARLAKKDKQGLKGRTFDYDIEGNFRRFPDIQGGVSAKVSDGKDEQFHIDLAAKADMPR